jgi:hypothetical protein
VNITAELLFNIIISIGAALLTWLTGYLLGHGVKYFVSRLLSRIGFEEIVKRTGFGRAIKRTGLLPHEFMGSLAAVIIYIVFAILGVYIAGYVLKLEAIMSTAETALYVYVAGGLKLLFIVLIGFTLVDAFVGYVYKSTELRAEMQLLYPMAEYLRIVLYIAIVVYGVEQSGLGVGVLPSLLTPIIWGITVIIVLFVLYLIVQSIRAPRPP